MTDGRNHAEWTEKVRTWWDAASDSEWYRSLRTEDAVRRLAEDPASAFHPGVLSLIRSYVPDLSGRRVLVPSSGDNHAAFAFALMGARVTSSDISERQLENASAVAEKLRLDVEFVRDDTAGLPRIPDGTCDLVYTSNGTLTWIDDLDAMDRGIFRVLKPGGVYVLYDMHPFNRPFSGEAGKEPRIVKPYGDVFPDLHWRVSDVVNALIRSGLTLLETAELPAEDPSFWYTFDELKTKRPEELESLGDWRKNPMAALPAWLALVSGKGEVRP